MLNNTPPSSPFFLLWRANSWAYSDWAQITKAGWRHCKRNTSLLISLLIESTFCFLRQDTTEIQNEDSLWGIPWWSSAFTAMTWVQSLVWELRFHKPHCVAKKKKKDSLWIWVSYQFISKKRKKKQRCKNMMQPHLRTVRTYQGYNSLTWTLPSRSQSGQSHPLDGQALRSASL